MDKNLSAEQEILSFIEKPACWAEIILPLALPKVYTFAIPKQFVAKALPGCRAEVVFGKNKKYAGIIKKIVDEEPPYATKPILSILDDDPLLYCHQLNLWQWMAQYYMCSEGEVMSAALPTNFKLSSETILIYNDVAGDDFSALDDDEFLVAEALLIRKQLNISEVQQLLDVSHVYPSIKKLIDKNICFIWETLNERYKVKTENYVLLNPAYNNDEQLSSLLNDWKGAPRQMEMLLAFIHLQKSEGEVTQPALLKKSGATSAQLKALADKQILIVEKRSVDRIKQLPRQVNIDFTLSATQQGALDSIKNIFTQKDVCLLHGVTGSGKTQVYITLIEAAFAKDLQVLYLLPEIALTAQIIRRLQKHFGGNIAIYHSRFNNQERIELWNKVRTGEVKIILGARSALFLPFKQLGLIIVDEEQDASYKQQDPAPRYNARDTAIFYASLFKAKVLLGSATPSVESYYNALHDKYGLVKLNERYGGIHLPQVIIINTRQVVQKGKVIISPQLEVAIENAIEKNEQVILFQNRRGFDPYIICGNCGYIPRCIHCDVSLTFHKFSNKLHCHYCSSTYPKLIACPACGSNNWLDKNFGTEKIEEILQEKFPALRIGRMDVDSIRGKTAHDTIIHLFEQKKIDILVGTQMVVKGLDFDHVSLVGILDADGLLSFADFRVNERAFQLMEQVSGRAGRKKEQGKVLLQAVNVKHPVLEWVKQHNYEKFYESEIETRKEFNYPPFSRIVKLILKHKQSDLVNEAAEKLAFLLRQDFQPYIIGPASPIVARLRNLFIKDILIKLPKETGKSLAFKKAISNHINLMLSEKKFKSVQVIADVDPV